ncbi:MAG: hypothetical protein CL792_04090 [Chloroflexi bacterium]|nr:hypothetical protein [Chloroflexota bacterium]
MSDRCQISLHRSVAIITDQSISIKHGKSGLVFPIIELFMFVVAVALLVIFINAWPLNALVFLLIFSSIVGPLSLIGLINNIVGTSFVLEKSKYSARWQQGLLGLGIGTYELVSFDRIDHFFIRNDFDDFLAGGSKQDLVEFEILMVKDNDKKLSVARVIEPREFVDNARNRINKLGLLLGEMASVEVKVKKNSSDESNNCESVTSRSRKRYRQI